MCVAPHAFGFDTGLLCTHSIPAGTTIAPATMSDSTCPRPGAGVRACARDPTLSPGQCLSYACAACAVQHTLAISMPCRYEGASTRADSGSTRLSTGKRPHNDAYTLGVTVYLLPQPAGRCVSTNNRGAEEQSRTKCFFPSGPLPRDALGGCNGERACCAAVCPSDGHGLPGEACVRPRLPGEACIHPRPHTRTCFPWHPLASLGDTYTSSARCKTRLVRTLSSESSPLHAENRPATVIVNVNVNVNVNNLYSRWARS